MKAILGWVLVAVGVCAVSSTGLFMFRPVGGELRRTLCLASEVTAMTAAIVAGFLASRRVTGADRRGWTLLTVAVAIGLGGIVVPTIASLDPRVAVVSSAMAVPFAIGALACFGSIFVGSRAWAAVLLEVFMVTGAVLVALWFVLGLTSPGLADVSNVDRLLLILIPTGHLLIVGLAATMLLSARRPARWSLLLLAAWAGLSAVGLTATMLATAHGTSVPASTRFLPIVATLLFVLSCRSPAVSRAVALDSHWARAQRGFVTTLPIAMVGLVALGRSWDIVSGTLGMFALAMVPAAVARLIITSRENQDLVTQLENRIALLRRRESELIAAREVAVAAQQSQRNFLSRTSHELRTPLHAVLGFAELMSLEPLSENQSGSLEEVRQSGGYLLELVDDLLDLACIEQGAIEIDLQPIPVAELMDEILRQVHPLVEGRDSTIELIDACSAGTTVLADRRRLRQVIVNLLTNAVKYAGGHIMLRTEARSESVIIEVVDLGPGIESSDVERLFVPFDRLEAQNGREPGAGLGLAVAHSLVVAMAGRLDVDSAVDVGTTFTVSMPLADSRRSHTCARNVTASVR